MSPFQRFGAGLLVTAAFIGPEIVTTAITTGAGVVLIAAGLGVYKLIQAVHRIAN